MLSEIAANFQSLEGEERDKEILRIAIVAELDSVKFYEQLASETDNGKLKEVLYGIAREEKNHLKAFEGFLPLE